MNYTHQHLLENVQLDPYTTLQCGGYARYFAVAHTTEDIKRFANIAQTESIPVVPLGGGSNIILKDKIINRFFIKIENKGIQIVDEDQKSVRIAVSAGELWHDFVLFTVEHGFSGIEALTSIPGICGSTPVQNVGAYGQEVSHVIESVSGYNIEKNIFETIDRDMCEFGYRDSIFKKALKGKFIITSLIFCLSKNDPVIPSYPQIDQELQLVQHTHPDLSVLKQIQISIDTIRAKKLPNPKRIPNVGSFFKNIYVSKDKLAELDKKYPNIRYFPDESGQYKISSGWLIECAGYKGLVKGGVGMYHNNALVLVNPGKQTYDNIFDYVRKVQHSVSDMFGLDLEIEPEIIS